MNKQRVPIRVLLVDDHSFVRRSLRSVIESRPGFRVVGEAADGEAAVALAASSEFDVVMLDISMPNMSGLEAARRLRRLDPEVRVIMVSLNNDAENIRESFKAGARGYLIKDAALDEIFAAVEEVHAGRLYGAEKAQE